MNSGAAFIAGVIATLPMTVVQYSGERLGLRNIDIPKILGTAVQPKQTARATGIIVHIALGGGFGTMYAALWHTGIGGVRWYWGLIFGGIHGIVASIVMRTMLAVHPRAPQVLGRDNIVTYILSHLVFGGVVAIVYRALMPVTVERK